MTDLYYLSQADGVGEWRTKEAKDLSDLVQNRITYLQVKTQTRSEQVYFFNSHGPYSFILKRTAEIYITLV